MWALSRAFFALKQSVVSILANFKDGMPLMRQEMEFELPKIRLYLESMRQLKAIWQPLLIQAHVIPAAAVAAAAGEIQKRVASQHDKLRCQDSFNFEI